MCSTLQLRTVILLKVSGKKYPEGLKGPCGSAVRNTKDLRTAENKILEIYEETLGVSEVIGTEAQLFLGP